MERATRVASRSSHEFDVEDEAELHDAPVQSFAEIQHNEHIFRSAPMTLVQMYSTRDVARTAVGELARLGCMHFCDLNVGQTSFQRQFVAEIRKLDELLQAATQMESLIKSSTQLDADQLREPLLSATEVEEIGNLLLSDFQKLNSLHTSYTQLTLQRDVLLEEREILRGSEHFFGSRSPQIPRNSPTVRRRDETPLLGSTYTDEVDADDFEVGDEEFIVDDLESGIEIGADDRLGDIVVSEIAESASSVVLAGTIERTKSGALERLCWRATRGNLYFSKFSLTERDAFMVYTHGKISAERVKRIAESMDARLLTLTAAGRETRLENVNNQLTELFTVLDQTSQTYSLEKELINARLPAWKAVIAKERAIVETMNLFSSDNGSQGLLAEGWVPSDRLDEVQQAAQVVSERTSQLVVVHTVNTNRVPPTFHTTNKVTAAFQAMVDVYGISRYGEVNPGLPMVVTFPFLFAVMFGDVGHGFILGLGALVMVLNEREINAMKQRDELFNMAYIGRYVLLFMGGFSIFTGFIYNDLFSRSMTIFNSAFYWPNGNGSAERIGNRVYPFGLDWAWHGAENNLRFTNSYKMKLSVLLGFIHMSYSLSFQLVNARHFNSWVDIWGNFVPGLIFMQSIFGYLAICIVYKWCVDWIGKQRDPPGLLDMLIKMFLSPGTIETPLYPGQAFAQCFLVLLALLCVPWLLLFKPLYLRKQMKAKHGLFGPVRLDEHTFAIDEEPEVEIFDEEPEEGDGHAHESFGDIMIHQVIHTIEFCLNCISHTASYLRLWALSLAHNQLSQVLWNMTLQNAFGPTGGKGIFMVVVLFGMWFVITVLVLVCMEGTSAMLHALRLQWVEAMSKHFDGEGYAFAPLDFSTLTE